MPGLALFGDGTPEVVFDRDGNDAMEAAVFDSLEAARELEAAGVERSHAAATVKTVVAAAEAGREGLATKADFVALKADFSALRADFAELKADFARVEGKLETKFAAAINRMLLSQLAVAGLLFAALKLF